MCVIGVLAAGYERVPVGVRWERGLGQRGCKSMARKIAC